ncbi:hypothetical protein [Escherichia phage vB_EcoP_PAS59]|uniref:Uncharacterized protein n=1 Tax=Escherichia phage vB_EcoP_PAS59 TaxID=3053873 RepID=A0AA51Z338_9CAUD|nr:hypothetical protein [Escherichia phage vB_EcoP_PAS59]
MIRAELTIPEGVTQFHAVWEHNNQIFGCTFKFFINENGSYWAYYVPEDDIWSRIGHPSQHIPCPETAMYLFCVV